MTFDTILDDKRLWAVRYEGEKSNCFELLFSNWYDMNWLRSFFQENLADLSSFKIEPGVYLVTGGAIKLTATMYERSHTLAELAKMERVRNYLLDNGVYDLNGFNDYIENEQDN